jgi:hypothetical protein
MLHPHKNNKSEHGSKILINMNAAAAKPFEAKLQKRFGVNFE